MTSDCTPFFYPPKDVEMVFQDASAEMSTVATKGCLSAFTHQTFWWDFVPNKQTEAMNAVIAAADAGTTSSNWRNVIALAFCYVKKNMKCYQPNTSGVAASCFVQKSASCQQVSWLRATKSLGHCPNCYCANQGQSAVGTYGGPCETDCFEKVDTECSAIPPFVPTAGADYWCRPAVSIL